MALTGGDILFETTHDGRVAVLTLSQPEKMNTITWEMRGRMEERFAEIDADDAIQAVVIQGRDGQFSPGGDIPGFVELEPVDFTALGQRLTAPARSPKPVIAAIDGYCLGAGLELSMSCDIRVATRRSKFGQPEMRLGMIPGSGGTQRLARLVGLTAAKYIVMTGEHFSAEQAVQWGLLVKAVEDVAALQDEVTRICNTLVGHSPLALRTAKEVLDRGVDGPLATGIELERKAYAMLRSSADFQEGVAAFQDKRTPKFQGR